MGAAPGNDLKLDENRIRGYKNFANKVWNITRFVLETSAASGAGAIAEEDRAIITEAQTMATEVTKHIETYRLDLAADCAYQFIWHRFADIILEESKPLTKGADKTRASSRASALVESLHIILATLHPFMPFVTEEIWDSLPHHKEILMVASWPVAGT
jgi:valyl-tRNA synthetase